MLRVGHARSPSRRCAACSASAPGVVNIGIEGIMLAARLRGLVRRRRCSRPMLGVGASRRRSSGPRPASADRARRGHRSPACSSRPLHAWLSISVRADQIISGTIINIAGLRPDRLPQHADLAKSPTGAGSFTAFTPPAWLTSLPVIGWIFETFLDQGPITMSADRHRDRLPGAAVPLALGPAHAGGRASTRRRPRRSASTSSELRYRNVSLGRACWRRSAGAYLSMEADQLVPGTA